MFRELLQRFGARPLISRFPAAAAGATLAAVPLLTVASAANAQVIQSDGHFASSLPLTYNGVAVNQGADLQLTDGQDSENPTIFTTDKVDVWAFHTSFIFTIKPDAAGEYSDGLTFCVQSFSLHAQGSVGGDLGYGGGYFGPGAAYIPKSMALKFDTYPNDQVQSDSTTGLYTDGAAPMNGIDMLPAGIDLHSGHPFQVDVTYYQLYNKLTEVVTDTQTGAVFTQSYHLDLASHLGGTQAYVGFTAGTGAGASFQSVGSWVFNSDYFQKGYEIGEPGIPENEDDTLEGGTTTTHTAGSALSTVSSVLNGYPKFESMAPDGLEALIKASGGGRDAKRIEGLTPYFVGTDTLTTATDLDSYLQEHVVTDRQHVLLKLSELTAGKPDDDHYVIVLNHRSDGDWNVFDPGWARDSVTPTGAIDTLSGHLNGFTVGGQVHTFTPNEAFLFAPSDQIGS